MTSNRSRVGPAWSRVRSSRMRLRDVPERARDLAFIIQWTGSTHDQLWRPSLTTDSSKTSRKAQIDALLLKLPGVSARKINNLDAYFVSDRMFACISGDGVGLRLPAATATEVQFSKEGVVPFQPRGMPSTREWIQINRADAADYEKDLELFRKSLEFVSAARGR